MQEIGWEGERQRAYLALRSVFHALRDRLTVEEALDLGAQLPMLIRGFYYEGWKVYRKAGSSVPLSVHGFLSDTRPSVHRLYIQ